MAEIKGLVIGKFYPPHKGHSLLIRTAEAEVDHLVVLVCEDLEQSISGIQRAEWLREMHPRVEVRVIADIIDNDDSEGWARYTINQLGYRPDVVFTSEDYGEAYARYMGCRHVLVDAEREQVPCAGRKIRRKPLKYWDCLDGPVKLYYLKRICLIGAESTGKTTLAQALANHYQTVWVPEYGRMYAEGKVTLPDYSHWESWEFTHIAQMQVQLAEQLAKRAERYLFADTDAVATYVWHQRYLDYASTDVEAVIATQSQYDLYLVTAPDIPFVQDGTRDGEHVRLWMHDQVIHELKRRRLPFEVVSGSLKHRVKQAVKYIKQLQPGRD